MRVAHTFWIALLAAVSIIAIPSKAIATDQMPLLKDKCGGCHYSEETDSYTRIFDARRTPEGWQMTLLRMRRDHGVELSNQERLDLIAFLSEKQGISVAETAGYRYALEREPVSVDQAPEAARLQAPSFPISATSPGVCACQLLVSRHISLANRPLHSRCCQRLIICACHCWTNPAHLPK